MAEAIAAVVSAAPEPAAPPAAARDTNATTDGKDGGFTFPKALSRHLDEGGKTAADDPAPTDAPDREPRADGKKLPPESAVLATLLLNAPLQPAAPTESVAPAQPGADANGEAVLAALLLNGQAPAGIEASLKSGPGPGPGPARAVSPAGLAGTPTLAGSTESGADGAELDLAGKFMDGKPLDPAQLLTRAATGGERPEFAAGRLATDGTEHLVRPAGLAALTTNTSPADSAGRPALAIPLPVAHPGWGSELGQRVMWMTNQQVSGAELRLSPPELGPLSVQISVDNDKATIQFNANQPLVREAIENALPRLREMLAGAGINLADVSVSQHGFTQAQQDQDPSGHGARTGHPDDTDALVAPPPRVMLGLLDLYA